MHFPRPRDDPVTKMTLASSATIERVEDALRVVIEDAMRGAKALELVNASAEKIDRAKRNAEDKKFMVSGIVGT
jgi:hypothetical protein